MRYNITIATTDVSPMVIYGSKNVNSITLAKLLAYHVLTVLRTLNCKIPLMKPSPLKNMTTLRRKFNVINCLRLKQNRHTSFCEL